MNLITARGIIGLIAMTYAAGMVVYFWHTFALIAALLLVVVVCGHKRSKPRVSIPAETLSEARRLQSYYSNRR